MKYRGSKTSWTWLLWLLILTGFPAAARACSACFGSSDSPLAEGMNWGIFSLLGVVLLVLGGVVAFFVFLVRRAKTMQAGALRPEVRPS